MSPDPVLHVLAGPNGSGKTTFYERILLPATGLPFVNADVIAAAHWPGEELRHAYDAARLAAEERSRRLAVRESFVTETVFSHASKLDLVRAARAAGFHVVLSVILIPADLAVARVVNRVEVGGHAVPEAKIRERFQRLWGLVRSAIAEVDHSTVYDNSRAATPYRPVARFISGSPVGTQHWPAWTPEDLKANSPDQLEPNT